MLLVKTISPAQEKKLLAEWFDTVQWDEESEGIPPLEDEEDDEGRSLLYRHGVHDQKTHGGGTGLAETATPELSNRKADDLASRVKTPDGGFTVDPRTGKDIKEGFAVAIYPDRSKEIPATAVNRKVLQDYVKDNGDLLSQSGNMMGGWHDPDSGNVWLDVSRVTNDRMGAIDLAKQNNQIAIFDLGSGNSINTGGTGRSSYPFVFRQDYQNRHLPGKHEQSTHGGTGHSVKLAGSDGPVYVQVNNGALQLRMPYDGSDDEDSSIGHIDTINLDRSTTAEFAEELDVITATREVHVKQAKTASDALDKAQPDTNEYQAAQDAWFQVGGDGQRIAGGELDGDVGALVYEMRMGTGITDTDFLLAIRPADADITTWDLQEAAGNTAGQYLSLAAFLKLRKSLESETERVMRHLPGKHNQSTHGKGDGKLIHAASTYAELSPTGQKAVLAAEQKVGVTRDGMAEEIDSKINDQNLAEGRAWYTEAQDFNNDLAAASGLSVEQTAAITSAVSPQTPWPRNKELATKIVMKYKDYDGVVPTVKDRHGKLDTPAQAAGRKMGGTLSKNSGVAFEIARGGSIDKHLSGVKRRSFYNNMVDPVNSKDITVDTWMARAAMNSTTKTGGLSLDEAQAFLQASKGITNGGAGTVSISESVRQVAQKRGVTPHEVQAAYWIAVSGSKNGARGD